MTPSLAIHEVQILPKHSFLVYKSGESIQITQKVHLFEL